MQKTEKISAQLLGCHLSEFTVLCCLMFSVLETIISYIESGHCWPECWPEAEFSHIFFL